ncbi:dTMP kinase, partial [bacterium]|nr:dTMP kinase [candidate division CSSED10-310 bacterium]
MTGRLITFEGIEGCGKSTQVRILHEKFIKSGKSVLVTREPGSGDFGEKIRQLLLRTSSVKLLPMTELFLLVADRSQHVESLIKPSLRAGKIVICDRYTDSSLAYQGFGRGIPLDLINTLNDQATGGVMPDLT